MIRFTEFNISEFCFVEIQFYKLSLKDLWMFNDERNLNRANSQLAKIQILQIFRTPKYAPASDHNNNIGIDCGVACPFLIMRRLNIVRIV